jgi:hypothetical protein
MSAKFEPIQVVDWETQKTEQSPTASGLRLMYFRISNYPPEEWIQLFDNQRQMPTGRNMLGGARAEVSGKHIILDCIPDEKEMQKQIDYLKHDASVANQNYQEYLKRVEAENLRIAQKQQAEMQEIEGIKSRIKI